jgi:D-amino-acid oxidase
MPSARVGIVGAGVMGLTTCYELLTRDYDVSLYFAEPPLNTTSSVATAIWHVYLVDPHDSQNLAWAEVTLRRLLELANRNGVAGVYVVKGVELFRRSEPALPPWHRIPPLFAMLSDSEVARYKDVAWGYRIAAPLAEMDKYLRWLYREVWRLGARLIPRRLATLEEITDDVEVIVNCSGLGARELVGDPGLQGVRGQYLILEKPDGVDSDYVGDDENPGGMTYVIPRKSDVCVGGTEEYGIEDHHFSLDIPDLLRRAADLVPWLADSRQVALRQTVVGLRPWRASGIRFETSAPVGGVPVIHNYGHGGSGFSLAWGCAQSVVEKLRQL